MPSSLFSSGSISRGTAMSMNNMGRLRRWLRNHLLQVIDIVNKDAVQLVQLGIDIAWDRDVDEKHGTVAALAEEPFAVLLAEDGVRRARGTDDDVGIGNGLVKPFEWDRRAVELFRQRRSAREGAVGKVDLRAAMRQQMAGSQFAHLAGAHQVNARALQVAKYLLGQVHCHRCDGYRSEEHTSELQSLRHLVCR